MPAHAARGTVGRVSTLTLPHRAWRLLPARARRAVLSRATAAIAPHPDAAPPPARSGVAVAGELSRASGLGEGARLMLAALGSLGVPTWPIDIGTALRPSADGAVPPPGVPLVIHVNAPLLPLVMRRLPRALRLGRQVIGYWAWELDVAPRGWSLGAGFAHAAWAPSRFSAAAIEPLLPGRVRVVGHPVAVSPPVPSALTRRDFGWPEAAVVVLVSFSLSSSFERKNPLGAIAAFRAAFGDRADRVLVLKVGQGEDWAPDMARLMDAVAGATNIVLERRTLPAADSHALTRAADIVLSLHRSEGFGLVPAEAMLLGRPVVATAWSGTMDYMDSGCVALVPATLIPARDPRRVFEARGAVWAEPDTRAAAAHLRRLADDPEQRRALGRAGRQAARARLGAEPLVAAVRALGLPVPGLPVSGMPVSGMPVSGLPTSMLPT